MKHELTDDELSVYSRQIVLGDIGYDGQLKLRNATACLVGLGGLGSLIASKLVGMGIGRLRLVDRDIVSRSDLHRQHLYDVDSIGQPKVEAALRKLARLNPDVELEPYPETLTAYNAEVIIGGSGVVLDGLDRPEPRYIVNRTCRKLSIPYIFGAAIEAFGNVTTVLPGRSICLECFMPGLTEADLPKCGVVGVHPSVLGVVTSVQVFEAVRVLTGQVPKLFNKLLYVDLREMTFETLQLSAEKDCPACGTGLADPPEEKLLEESCARDGRRNIVVTPTERIDLDLVRLKTVLEEKDFRVKFAGRCGITFELSKAISACILKRGGMVAQMPPRANKDLREMISTLYRSILVEGMGYPGRILPEAAAADETLPDSDV